MTVGQLRKRAEDIDALSKKLAKLHIALIEHKEEAKLVDEFIKNYAYSQSMSEIVQGVLEIIRDDMNFTEATLKKIDSIKIHTELEMGSSEG